ncbi:MAG: hypothetical protein K2X00_11160 [Nitrospiraceae bacterium]|nr:hypothetical protein [Nitrospiraceae bacterium]
MSTPLPDLTQPVWTAKLASALERAAASIGRLDARVSVSSVALPWQRRASWTGYTTALRAQGAEIDEIDIFGRECAVNLPGRRPLTTNLDDRHALPSWQRDLTGSDARHWRDELAIATDLPEDWNRRPALLRALEITARHARADGSIAPWLAVPTLLRSMRITQTVLPCLVIGDRALRLSSRDAQPIILRNLRSLTDHAAEGLVRLQAIEDDRLRAAEAVSNAHRPGKLIKLLALLQFVPVLSPRLVGQQLSITISGAGKLLARAADMGILVEVSGRQAWRTYMARDIAIAFGFVKRPIGRPLAPQRYVANLEPALADFDREMIEVDSILARLGIAASVDTANA